MLCSFEAIRSILRFIFGQHAKTNIPKLPMGLPRALVRVVDCDTDTDNRTGAMNCLNNMALSAPASVLADDEAITCALRVMQQQGTGAHTFTSPVFVLLLRRCTIFRFTILPLTFFPPPVPVQIWRHGP